MIEQQRDRYLPEVLRRAGYQTRGISANLWISQRNGFSAGFDSFHDASGHRVAAMARRGWRAQARWYLHALQAKADDGAEAVESLLSEWITTRPRAPFFWFVNLIECHSPYLPPKPWNDIGPLGRLAAARDARRYQTLEGVLRARATGQGAPERATRRMRHLYDRSIELMDAWLARVLELLAANNLLDDTLVVLTSDHGENFGEGSLLGHAPSMDDRLLWVPLIMRGPGAAPARSPVTSLAHLPRMLAEAARLSHPWEESEPNGVAVAQYDGPVRPGSPGEAYLSKIPTTAEGMRHLTERFTCATNGRLKLVSTVTTDEVYDLEADPLELSPRPASDYPESKLRALRAAVEATRRDEWDPAPPAEPSGANDADLQDRMRMLGYL